MIILGAAVDPAAASMAIASLLADAARDAPVAGTQVLTPTLLLGDSAEAGRAEMEAVLSVGAEGFVLWIPPNHPRLVPVGGTKAESVVVAAAPSPAGAKAVARKVARLSRTRARLLHVRVLTRRDGMLQVIVHERLPCTFTRQPK